METFVCTHCGHRFEKEPLETVICPKCFWSTSVKKEMEEVQKAQISEPSRPIEMLSQTESRRPWLWLGGVLFVALFLGVSVFVVRHLKKQNEILKKIESKNAQVIATEAPELGLSENERETLNRKVSLPAERSVSEKEKEILTPRISLRSRLPEGVAVPPWDQKHFEEFLKQIELQYKIPLDWTYRRKLTRLFREHYLLASQAFEAKDFLKARDEWIHSLAFPVYRNNIQKHRGVVLTMLRSYINDTLSKIGAMNAALTAKTLYGGEQKVHSTYKTLMDLIQKESWEEANAQILELGKQLDELEKLPKAASPPSLPKEISLVDPDIQEVLRAQINPVEPALPDLASLKQDLAEKEKVIQSRLPETMETVQKQYDEALTSIQNGNWQAARDLLQKIDFPAELAEDAHMKLEILNKFASPSLDSKKNSG